MRPEGKYIQCVPSRIPMEGDHAFVISVSATYHLGSHGRLTDRCVSYCSSHELFAMSSSLGIGRGDKFMVGGSDCIYARLDTR